MFREKQMGEFTVEKEETMDYFYQERGPMESTCAGRVESKVLQDHDGNGHSGGQTHQPQRMKMMKENSNLLLFSQAVSQKDPTGPCDPIS